MIAHLALFLVCLCVSNGYPDSDSEFVLNFDSPVYVCPDEFSQEFFECSDVEVERHNETISFMKGKFSFLKEMDRCALVEMIVQKDQNGRVEVMVTHEICDLCAETHEGSDYYKYLKYFGFPESCPFEGEYTINNFVVDSDDFPVNRINEARYQVTLNFYHNPECDCKDNRVFQGCLKLDFVIEPL